MSCTTVISDAEDRVSLPGVRERSSRQLSYLHWCSMFRTHVRTIRTQICRHDGPALDAAARRACEASLVGSHARAEVMPGAECKPGESRRPPQAENSTMRRGLRDRSWELQGRFNLIFGRGAQQTRLHGNKDCQDEGRRMDRADERVKATLRG